MTIRELKIPLSCRVYPELKAEVEVEAFDQGVTTSQYLESIILERRSQEFNKDEIHEEVPLVIDEYDAKIESLENEIDELKTAHAALLEYHQRIIEKERSLEGKTDLLRLVDFDGTEKEELQNLLDWLRTKYPDKEDKQLILASLHAAKKNEKSVFIIHTLDGVFGNLL